MARDEEKSEYLRLSFCKLRAQSTLEYAIIFPLLFFMIMGIWELAFMWHQYNSMEMAAQSVSSNLALIKNHGCSNDTATKNEVKKMLIEKTSYLNLQELDFDTTKSGSIYYYKSKQSYGGRKYLSVAIDCSSPSEPVIPTVQFKAIHRLMFFSAKLPDFRGGSIEIIPDSVEFVSTKNASARQF